MNEDVSSSGFHSILGPLMEKFLQEKRSCGYRYHEETRILRHFDGFVSKEELMRVELPGSVAKKWLSRTTHESSRTHQQRITVVRQFSRFLCRLGYCAYVPDWTLTTRRSPDFVPRILSREEIGRLLKTVDQFVPTARSPLRHLIMPEIFRLLYGCGFRLGEVLNLHVGDVDLNQGVVTVRQGKFCKDRLVPLALSLVNRLKACAAALGNRSDDATFFPSRDGGPYKLRTIYGLFRKLLLQCGMAHGGRGQGPRVHDLRHAFAVHTLLRWYREGADLDARLPLLSTYLGHQHLSGTQRYLHLTAELFPEVIARVDAAFGDVIPGRLNS
jgi:integrase/recombinase XerD